MDDFYERIKARLVLIKIIIEKTAKYIAQVEEIVRGYNPLQYDEVITAIARMRVLYAQVTNTKINIDDPTECMIGMTNLYSQLLELEQLFDVSYRLFANETYARAATYNKSATYDNEAHRERKIVLDSKDKLATVSAQDDDNMFAIIFPRCGKDEIFNYIMSIPVTINKFTTALIAYALRQDIGPAKQKRFQEIIEQQKDMLLSSGVIPATPESMCTRFSLLPGPVMNIEELLLFIAKGGVITTDVNSTTDYPAPPEKTGGGDQIAEVASSGHGIIIIDISTPSPILNNIAGLIDTHYVMENDLNMKKLSGLTKKVLTRYTTTSVIDTKTAPPGPVKIYQGKLHTWFIATKIGETAYRPMYNQGYIHTNPQILTGISTRPMRYNALMRPQIMAQDGGVEKIKHMVADYEEDIRESPEPAVAKISDNIMKIFNATTIKTPEDFQTFLTLDKLTQAIMRSLHPTMNEKNVPEHLITYMLHMDAIATQMQRNMYKHISQSLTRLFAEYSDDALREALRNRLESIIKKVVVEINELGLFKNYNYGLKGYILRKTGELI